MATTAAGGVAASVVIPAHDEETVLARCLTRLLEGSASGEWDVVVVANGCSDSTAEVARCAGVRVLETSHAGKVNALRLGDAECVAFPRIYLDADVELDLESARALVRASARPGILACSPQPSWETTGAGSVVRRVHRVHDLLVAPRRGLAGVGVYVLTEVGHARVFPLPDILADDEYVHRSFATCERLVVDNARCVVRPARTVPAHLRRRARLRHGNRQLATLGRLPVGGRLGLSAIVALLRSRGVSPVDAVCYLAVMIAERALDIVRRRCFGPGVAWSTDSGSRRGNVHAESGPEAGIISTATSIDDGPQQRGADTSSAGQPT